MINNLQALSFNERRNKFRVAVNIADIYYHASTSKSDSSKRSARSQAAQYKSISAMPMMENAVAGEGQNHINALTRTQFRHH